MIILTLICRGVSQDAQGRWWGYFVCNEGETVGVDIELPKETANELVSGTAYYFPANC